MGYVSVSDKSVVTSGGYERYFDYKGKRYHHILDPRTGFPSENEIASVTVISDLSIDGDALTTCCYVLGLEAGMRLIEDQKGIDALIITDDRKVIATTGLKERLQLTDDKFRTIR